MVQTSEREHVVYVRDLGTGRGCGIDRQLAARLHADARAVRIGRVLAAPGCASRATALLVFGRVTAAVSLAQASGLAGALRARRGAGRAPCSSARSMLSRARGLTLRPGEAWIFSRAGVPAVRVRPHGWGAFLTPVAPQRFREWGASASQTHPHDIWPAGDGTVWYTAQFRGAAGRLEVATGAAHEIPLGPGSAPHGVVADADGNAWITDQGLERDRARRPPDGGGHGVPRARGGSNPNTAVFDARGVLWFTGAGGCYGRLDPRSAGSRCGPHARGGGAGLRVGPYGIAATPTALSTSSRLRAAISVGSIRRPARSPSSTPRRRTRVLGACGPTRGAACG